MNTPADRMLVRAVQCVLHPVIADRQAADQLGIAIAQFIRDNWHDISTVYTGDVIDIAQQVTRDYLNMSGTGKARNE